MVRPAIILCSLVLALAASVGGAQAATSRTATPRFNPVSPLVMPLWEVNAQNLTCEEINQIRELSLPGVRNPSMGQVMGYIANLPQHNNDRPRELFGPILQAWGETADQPGAMFNVNPGAAVPRPGEIKMLGYLDFAARQRNC